MTRAIIDIAPFARDIGAWSGHRRQERACQPEGIQSDL